MRKQLLGLFIPLLVLVMSATAADMTGKEVAASARLQKLEIAHGQDGVQIEFKAKGTLAPKVSTLESPARIVVDLPNTVMATAENRISVGRDGVQQVRIGTDGHVPPTTHVVVDMASSGRHAELVAGRDGTFTLKIEGAELASREPVKAPQAAVTSAPVASAAVSPAPATMAPATVA